MISYSEAQKIIAQKTPEMPSIRKNINEALGFVLAQDIQAISDLPPFDNSAMDGFALQTKWLHNHRKGHITKLPHAGVITAGSHIKPIDENAAIAIMTGAKIPPDYDAVIPIENVTIEGDFILISSPVHKGDNLRPQGSDISKGSLLLKKGTLLNAYHISMLGAQSLKEVHVFRKPKIAVIITGDEVGETNQSSGQIADANGPFLTAAIKEHGGELVELFHMNDNHEKLAKKIKNIQSHVDLIISTGAVSAGIKDFIPAFILSQKGLIHFHKLYQRPGKPLLFAQLEKGLAWFGLPGNPVAVQAGFDFSVQTWIRASQQRHPPKKCYAYFKGSFKKKEKFRQFLRGLTYSDTQGQLIVELQTAQASYQLKNWGNANSWIIAPEGIKQINEGDRVEIVKV